MAAPSERTKEEAGPGLAGQSGELGGSGPGQPETPERRGSDKEEPRAAGRGGRSGPPREETGPVQREALGSDEDDVLPIDLGLAQMAHAERQAEKMAADLSANKGGDSRAVEDCDDDDDDDDEDSNQDYDCQYCGAWFETLKGLTSHCRAHLRQMGVSDPDEKGSPIATLSALMMSEEFKKKMSGQKTADSDRVSKVAGEGNSSDMGAEPLNGSPKAKEAGAFAKPVESTKNQSSDSPVGLSKSLSRSITLEGGLTLTLGTGPIETSAHFKSPTSMGNTKQIKIVEAGAPHLLSPEAHARMQQEIRTTQIKLEAGHGHGYGNQHRPSLGGLMHHRPHPNSTPPAKKMKESSPASKSNLDAFWAQKNSSTPINLSSQSDPTRDIRCEFCNEFFENRKGLSSHARSHLRQMGVTEWHVNGSPIDTLREIVRKRSLSSSQPTITNIKKEPRGDDEPPSPSHRLSPMGVPTAGMARDHHPISPTNRHPNSFLSPMPTKRQPSHEPRLVQSEPKGYMNTDPKTLSQPKSFILGEARPKHYMLDDDRPKTFIQADGRPKPFFHSSDGNVKVFMHDGRPKGFLSTENRPKPFLPGEGKAKTFFQGDIRIKSFMPGQNKPKPFLHGEPKHKAFSPDGKPKAYIQTELPFKVKVKPSPEKSSLEANCELCGLVFENRKALASHARAHLRQFGVTEWCVNGSPIETLREWMKQRPQKAGAYLNYIQGRPYSKKFKRAGAALQSPKSGPEKESPTVTPVKVAEKDIPIGTPTLVAEKPPEPPVMKIEKRHPKAPEVPPPVREDTVAEPLPKNEESRPPVRVRPVPSLVPRPPQTSLVKFVGNIYTLKCRFCDVQFQGPLSIQEQWVRHLQHHILETNFSKFPSPPHTGSAQELPEATKSQ